MKQDFCMLNRIWSLRGSKSGTLDASICNPSVASLLRMPHESSQPLAPHLSGLRLAEGRTLNIHRSRSVAVEHLGFGHGAILHPPPPEFLSAGQGTSYNISEAETYKKNHGESLPKTAFNIEMHAGETQTPSSGRSRHPKRVKPLIPSILVRPWRTGTPAKQRIL